MPSTPAENAPLSTRMANAIRFLAIDAVEAAKSGHPGMPMGMADVATVLWSRYLRFDPTAPRWANRDRFILSGGHGSMLHYALSYLTGYPLPLEELKRFRQWGSRTPGHPERDPEIGIEMTTGPLGQGLATSVGFALAERILAARFGKDLMDHTTFVMAGDGDMMEGLSHEAASLAATLKLGRLVVYYDDNGISIDGPTTLSFTEDVAKRFEAYGWHVQKIDGHDQDAIAKATDAALAEEDRPSLIACRTTIGFGAPTKAGTSGCHGSPLGAEEIEATRKALNWPYAPFEVPEDVLSAWREAGSRSRAEREAWENRLTSSPQKEAFEAAMKGEIPTALVGALQDLKAQFEKEGAKKATRQSSGQTLATLMPVLPELIGGSADLTPSNNTAVKGFGDITPPSYEGRYIHYGVREHGMAAAMNGMSLHGGVIPYGGTFLQFADYSRPAIRLAALMQTRTIFVMTHDSIGLGEDGPTHQPVEHLSALRAIPNLYVFRPMDAIETAECWQIALESAQTPSLLALSRQGLPLLRKADLENKSAKGGYVLLEAEGGKRDVTLLATGSEVSLAVEARALLAAKGLQAAIVSLPCFELFDLQSESYREAVLGNAPRIGIEAGLQMSWDKYLCGKSAFIGMKGFGASAPAAELYKQFGITSEAVVEAAEALIK